MVLTTNSRAFLWRGENYGKRLAAAAKYDEEYLENMVSERGTLLFKQVTQKLSSQEKTYLDEHLLSYRK